MAVNLIVEPTADAPGLTLRPWGESDLPAVIAAYQDPAMRRWLSTRVEDEATARAWLLRQTAGWAAGDRLSFAIVERDRPVGHVVLRRADNVGRGGGKGSGTGGSTGSRVLGPAALALSARRPRAVTALSRTAEVGYWTLAEARGRGIASRTVEAATGWLFGLQEFLPADRVQLIHEVGNEASCRVAAKCGYALAEVLPPHPPRFSAEGHLHIRERPAGAAASVPASTLDETPRRPG